jgi:hypothetical protein
VVIAELSTVMVVKVVGVVVVVCCWKLALQVVVLWLPYPEVEQFVLPVWLTTAEPVDDPFVCAIVKTCPEGFEEPPAPFVVERVTLVLTLELLAST